MEGIFSKLIETDKENIFEKQKNNKRNINISGNIILLIHENKENINEKFIFPRLSKKISDGLMVIYCKSGKISFELVNNDKVLISNGDMFVSKPALIKNITKINSGDFIIMYLKKDFFTTYFGNEFSISGKKQYELKALKSYARISFDRALNYNVYPKNLQKVFIISKILDGLLTVSSIFLNIDFIKNRMEYVKNYIISNLDEHLTIKHLSNKALMSQTNFKIKFKEYFGVNSKQYISDLRLELSKELLLTTSLDIKEIFLKVGIENYQTFYNLFLSKYGVSPSKLRMSVNETFNRG